MFSTTYTANQLKNEIAERIKMLHNPKKGVSVSVMPAKINGCFQSNYKRVKVVVDDDVIGRTCNRDEHEMIAEQIEAIVREFSDLFQTH